MAGKCTSSRAARRASSWTGAWSRKWRWRCWVRWQPPPWRLAGVAGQLARAERGQLFGEMAILMEEQNSRRCATVRAVTSCDMLTVDGDTLRKVLAEHSAVLEKLLEGAMTRAEETRVLWAAHAAWKRAKRAVKARAHPRARRDKRGWTFLPGARLRAGARRRTRGESCASVSTVLSTTPSASRWRRGPDTWSGS